MDGKTKHMLGMLMGLVILVLDGYWTYLALGFVGNTVPQALGVLIFIATLIWLWADM